MKYSRKYMQNRLHKYVWRNKLYTTIVFVICLLNSVFPVNKHIIDTAIINEEKEVIVTESDEPKITDGIEHVSSLDHPLTMLPNSRLNIIEQDREQDVLREKVHEESTEDESVETTVATEVVTEPIPEVRMDINSDTYNVLLRVVEAEITGESYKYKGNLVSYDELLKSKIRVAQVFMNRVENTTSFKYTETLYEALTEKGASSTFLDGRYYEVKITDITKEAVRLALLKDTPDYTDGALFFSSGTTSCKYGDLLFVDSVGHAFFK